MPFLHYTPRNGLVVVIIIITTKHDPDALELPAGKHSRHHMDDTGGTRSIDPKQK